MAATGPGVVEQVATRNAADLAPSRGEATSLAVFVHGFGNPVDGGVLANGREHGVDENDLEVLVDGVLVDPVRVEHAQGGNTAADPLLGEKAERALALALVAALVLRATVNDALLCLLLHVAAADTHAVNNVARFRLETKRARAIRPARAHSAVDVRQLTVLPAANAKQKAEHVRLLVSRNLLQVLVGTHLERQNGSRSTQSRCDA